MSFILPPVYHLSYYPVLVSLLSTMLLLLYSRNLSPKFFAITGTLHIGLLPDAPILSLPIPIVPKRTLLNNLGISKEKLKVVYLANNQQKLEVKDKRQPISVQNNRSIQNNKRDNLPYILWVGKMFTHKNLDRVLRAYSKLIKIKHINHQLIICGMRGWGYPTFARTVEELNLQDRVTFKGYVPNDVLRSIYAKASLFVFPSLVEGFGLPMLEAMSYRVPVITSNYGAMAEVAGDAALLVDPYSVDEIAEAMHRVLTDETLRVALIKKGLRRASQFSWEKTARETLAVHERACEQK